MIVVATHADGLPHSNYKDCVAQLQSRLKELYSHGEDSFAYPKNCTPMHVVNCRDNKHMDQLRTVIYNTAVQYCPPRKCGNEMLLCVCVCVCVCVCSSLVY